MEPLVLVRQAMLFAHTIAFAIALSAVLREDWSLLRERRIDTPRLAATARTLTVALAVLWATGLSLIAIDIGLDAHAIAASPKLAAKLLVVTALTANGAALHVLAFPLLRSARPRLAVPVVLGAISTASWLYASFIGVSRAIAPLLSFADFLLLYAALLAASIGVALLVVKPRLDVANLQVIARRGSHTHRLARTARAPSTWSTR